MADRLVKLEIAARLHRFRAHFAEALQIIRVLAIDNNGRVPRGFVHDVGRGRVFDVMDLTHVARDHENFVGLKFHERGRGNKTIHRYRPPINPAEDVVHFLNPRDALKRDAGIEQQLEIGFVGVLLQEKNVLAHDETPDRVIDRGVFFVALIDCELQQMFWERLHCAISSAERLNTHRGFLRAHKRRLILRCLNVSSKKGLSTTAGTWTSWSVRQADILSAFLTAKQRSATPLGAQTGKSVFLACDSAAPAARSQADQSPPLPDYLGINLVEKSA